MHVKAYWGFQFLQNTFEKKKQRAILISEPVCGIHILVFMEEKKNLQRLGITIFEISNCLQMHGAFMLRLLQQLRGPAISQIGKTNLLPQWH